MHATSNFHYIAQTLKKGGVLVCPDGEDPVVKYEYLKDIEQRSYPDVTRLRNPVMLRLIARAFKARARLDVSEAGPKDVFLASSYFLPDLLPMISRAQKQGVPTACYVFHLTKGQRKMNSIKNILVALHEKVCLRLLKKVDILIVINEITRKKLLDAGFENDKIFTTQCPLNIEYAREMVRPEKKTYDMVFCGRFVEQKGVRDFLKTFELVKQTKPDVKAVMIGAGPLLNEVTSYIEEHFLDIETPGFVTEEEKFDYLRDGRLFVFPSYEEGWGIVLNEAMLVGTPALAYKLPIYQSIFGNNVEVATKGDFKKLAEQASAYLQHIHDDSDWYISQQATQREFALQFSLERTAQREWDRIRKILPS